MSSTTTTAGGEAAPSTTITADEPQPSLFIKEGDSVMIRYGDVLRMVQVKNSKKSQTKVGKVLANVASLIGKRFGSDLELDEKTRNFKETTLNSEVKNQVSADANDGEKKKDNRFLEDTHGNNQQLGYEDVIKLQEAAGMKGMVDKLVENSASFDQKTAFAQEKYKRKKQTQYALLVRVERVTVTNFCDLRVPTNNPDFMEGGPDDTKNLQLRIDAVSQLMHYGNIKFNARVLLVDESNGFLPAALLTRLGDEGKIYQIFEGRAQPTFNTSRAMNIDDVKARWKAVPMNPFLNPEEFPGTAAKADGEGEVDQTGDSNNNGSIVMGRAAAAGGAAESGEREQAWIGGKIAREQLSEDPPTTLMIASGDPLPFLRDLLPFLELSGSIVLYCPSAEPLFQAYQFLRKSGEAVAIRVADAWYREYQVLPGRTHPTVTMSGTGGYILSAVKVMKRAVVEGDGEGEGDSSPVERQKRGREDE